VSVDELVAAARLYLVTASNREFVAVLGSGALALITTTASVMNYLSNRTLRDEVEATRNSLKTSEIELVRLRASVEEQRKALERWNAELSARAKLIAKQEENRRNLLEILKQSDEDVWIRHLPVIKPAEHDVRIGRRKPIVVTIANNKGGVAKSTTTLNIAAHFDKHPLVVAKKRLIIDMDYQGTTSYVLTTAIDITERESRRACAPQCMSQPESGPTGKRPGAFLL
jgi:hypothetical protein